jgi:cation/acetate symporter
VQPAQAQASSGHDPVAIGSFLVVIALTMIITGWAARRTHTADEFFAAGSRVAGWQNGLAIAGDFMSAATFLGITALYYTNGFDAVLYTFSALVAFAVLVLLMAERLRHLGRYTFADVVCARLNPRPLRIFSATAALASALVYLVAQMVGAGGLIQVMFGIDYAWAVVVVGGLMMSYVAFGGMLATTWVQITKAVLLLAGVGYLVYATLAQFGFSFPALYDAAHARHRVPDLLYAPGGLGLGLLAQYSLAFGLTFGVVGSPHILMRFFTVPDAAAARQSAFVAMVIILLVFLGIFYVVAPGATALVAGDPRFLDASGQIIGGTNMVAIHLAYVAGGRVFLGFISAVAFATILAVVAGLTLASASAVAHDLYAKVWRSAAEGPVDVVGASRLATLAIGVAMIALAIACKGQNIAYLIALALGIAASTSFPVLLLSMYWPGLTSRGALTGGTLGLATAVGGVLLGPTVWVEIMGHERALFPSAYPALTSMTVAFAAIGLVSSLDRSERARVDRENFELQYRRA